MWYTLDKDNQMWYTALTMKIFKKIIMNLFRDEDFTRSVMREVLRPGVLQLDPKKKYILLLDTPIDKDAETDFVEKLRGYDIVLLTGATGRLLELTMEE